MKNVGLTNYIRPLFQLSQRRSDNSSLLIVFKVTFYELCICKLRHDFEKADSVFKHSQYFEDDESRFVVTILCHLLYVVYSDQKVKTSDIS